MARWVTVVGIVCAVLAVAPTSSAADGPAEAVEPVPEAPFGIHDRAALFRPDTVRRAEDVIRFIRHDHGRDVLVETYPTLPGIPRGPGREQDRNDFCTGWMEQRGKELGVRGLMVMVVTDPPHVQVYVGRTTTGLFTQADREELIRSLVPALKGRRFDEALVRIVGLVKDRMDRHAPPAEPGLVGLAD